MKHAMARVSKDCYTVISKHMRSKRHTVQKQVILDAVGELDRHATAEQVYEHVVLTYPSISKATVYRNLRQLAESGELTSIGTFYGSTHYDHRCHEHSHFVCDQCKQVFDVAGDFSDIISRAETSEGITIRAYRLSFSGICQKCENLKDSDLSNETINTSSNFLFTNS